MKPTLLLVLCALGSALGAEAAPLSATAQAPADEAPAPTGHVRVRLKDGQVLDALLQHSDKYFLSVNNAKGTHFDIPWSEVEALDSADLGAELAPLRANIKAGPAEVSSLVEPRRGGTAFQRALWPGILLHGAGHRYAGDSDAFVSLAGGELFGVVVGGFGLSELLGEGKAGESKDTALALSVGGGAIFGLTWLYDLAFAPGAARKFNEAKGLSLQPRLNGLQLAYRF
jgi:hypothetical protein